MSTSTITFEQFSLRYKNTEVLSNVNLEITKGECIALIGPNGSGKTSLLKSVVGLCKPYSGKVLLGGKAPTRKWLKHFRVGYVPQLKTMDLYFPLSVYEVVLMGRTAITGYLRRPSREDHIITECSLRQVKMLEYAKRPLSQLSGGQQQRVFIARALAQEPEIFILDEPATGLDIPSQQSIYELLEELHGDGITTITSTHDLLAFNYHNFDRIICLNKKIVAVGPSRDVLTPEILTETFAGFPLLHYFSTRQP